MASSNDNIWEYNNFDSLFEDLEPFTADQLLDFISRYSQPAATSSNPGLVPTNLSSQTVVGENKPQNLRPFNLGNNDLNNDSETIPSEPPFLCPWPKCNRREPFSNKATLKRHYNFLHVAPGSFECDKCPSTFNRKDNLKQHLRSAVHEDKTSLSAR